MSDETRPPVIDVSQLSGWKLLEAACRRLKEMGIGPDRAADVFGDAPEMLTLLRDIEARTPALPGVFKERIGALLDRHPRG